ELAHRDAVGPGGPFGGGAALHARHARAQPTGGDRMGERLAAGGDDRGSGEGGDGDGGVVDDAVDDHLRGLGIDLDGINSDLGHLPGELLLVREVLLGAVDADRVLDHGLASWRMKVGEAVGAVVGDAAPSRWASAWRRWTMVLAAASSGSPLATERAMSACSRAESARRAGELRARRRTRPRCRRSPRSDSAR